MGPDRRTAQAQRVGDLTRLAQVVPDVPSFSVDDGFTYEVPEVLAAIDVGDLVRIPLGGRRVRGYVTNVSDGTPDRALRSIAARSGKRGVFGASMLESLRWAATHYVAPLSTVLSRCTPPNVPRGVPKVQRGPVEARDGVLSEWAGRQVEKGRTRPAYLLHGDPVDEVIAAIAPVLSAGNNVIVAAPTVTEAHSTVAALRSVFAERVWSATAEDTPAQRTRAWTQLAEPTGSVVVGTREVAFWGTSGLGLAIVIDEGRRAYKSPQTPTYHVREVLRRRSVIERFGLLLTGAVPTSEALAAGVEIVRERRRIWPLVDVVDRTAESAGSGLVSDRSRHVLAAMGDFGTAFVLVPRRGGAYRCSRCRELHVCVECGSMLDRAGQCPRCSRSYPSCTACHGTRFEALGASIPRIVADLRRTMGSDVGPAGSGSRISVGTERDLVGAPRVDLVVIVDPDTALLAPTYRAEEDALRLLARAVLVAKPGRGRRALIESRLPEHRVLAALRSGDPVPFMAETQQEREKSGFPPVGELLAIETDAEGAHELLEAATEGVALLGPVAEDGRERWLVQGSDLGRARVRLRAAIQQLRDAGARVRIDVDPVEL
ncbi:MAG: hypothetical protein ABFS21_01155 [Actinomycetota bacterium]